MITVRQANDTVYGGDGDDVIATQDEDPQFGDQLYGDAGNDTISGANTNDQLYGGTGNDQLSGGGNTDTLDGGEGNDALDGGAGNDLLYGGDGDDLINAGAGNDTSFGGAGADTFLLQDPLAVTTIFGGEAGVDFDTLDLGSQTAGVSILYTGAEAGTITGAALAPSTFQEIENLVLTTGNDTVDASADTAGIYVSDAGGADTILGGSGNDTVFAGGGDDSVAGGSGNDSLSGGAGNDTLSGGAGADTLSGGAGADSLAGGDGDDAIDLGAMDGVADFVALRNGDDRDTVTAFEGPVNNGDGTYTGLDQLDVSDLTDATGQPVNTADVVVSDDGAGNAVLTFPNGESVTLIGIAPSALGTPAALVAIGIPPTPDLVVDGTGGNDAMTPGYVDAQGDIVDGADGLADTIFGYGGNDSIQAGLGNDVVFGGTGNDLIAGDAGDDTLDGGAGDDALSGGDGNDTVGGDLGNDTLFGGAGDDLLDGGAGDDTVDAGAGDDRCRRQ